MGQMGLKISQLPIRTINKGRGNNLIGVGVQLDKSNSGEMKGKNSSLPLRLQTPESSRLGEGKEGRGRQGNSERVVQNESIIIQLVPNKDSANPHSAIHHLDTRLFALLYHTHKYAVCTTSKHTL